MLGTGGTSDGAAGIDWSARPLAQNNHVVSTTLFTFSEGGRKLAPMTVRGNAMGAGTGGKDGLR